VHRHVGKIPRQHADADRGAWSNVLFGNREIRPAAFLRPPVACPVRVNFADPAAIAVRRGGGA
jgi:hypothetical protein